MVVHESGDFGLLFGSENRPLIHVNADQENRPCDSQNLVTLAGQFVFSLQRKGTHFIESKAFVYRFARNLSKFYLKSHLYDSKSSDN